MKATFQLYKTERKAMMRKIAPIVQHRLSCIRFGDRIKFKELSKIIGVPTSRISEAHRKRYVNEYLIKQLAINGYLSHNDFSHIDLTPAQKTVLLELMD